VAEWWTPQYIAIAVSISDCKCQIGVAACD
jgi:hypothetical protein